ncbi:MAG: hypothetical protein AAF456_08660 [Planctomycetota bacterium]
MKKSQRDTQSQGRKRSSTRRQFIGAVAGSALVGSSGLQRLFADSYGGRGHFVPDDLINYRDEIEPYVRLLEDTPREDCFGTFVQQMNSGMSYRQLMSTLFLAGIRNIDSAQVGGNLHTVFVVHSAHQLGLDSSIDQRLLPMFWAIDYFKRVQEGGRQIKPMKPFASELPELSRPFDELEQGCIEFDSERIERAMVTLVRTRGAAEVAEPLWRLAARDFIPLGHKAIYMANAWRTLQTIGWQYAEPTLRSLGSSLASYHGSGIFSMENQCYNSNLELARAHSDRLPMNWAGERSDPAFVRKLVPLIRTGDHQAAATLVVDELVSGAIEAQSVWDAVHLAAGEIILRVSNIGSMHGITASNAVHYAFTQASGTETRLLLLLQGVGFVCHFIPFLKEREQTRGTPFPERDLLAIEPVEIAAGETEATEAILDVVSTEPHAAASQALSFASRFNDHRGFLRAARRLVYAKGDEAHRYKFAAAVMEDLPLVSNNWKPHMLAASTQYFCGATLPDSPVMERAREALNDLR